MKAVIMAGGEGTRLRPLTCNRPKPMVPVVNKPVMEHIVELLKAHNFKDIAVTLQYMPELVKEYFDDGSEYGVNMRYYVEESPLGTAGSVKNAEEFLDETFLVISGDAITDIDLTKAVDFHFKKKSVATLVLKKVDIPLEYGVVVTNEDGEITRFLEKPSWGEVFSDTVNTGIYILSPEIFKYYKKNEMFDFSKDLFPMLLKEKVPMYGYITEDYWCDIGDHISYIQSHIDIMEGKVKVNIPGKQVREKVWVDEGTQISEDAEIQAPCIIGKNCSIKEGATIHSYSVIGENNIIGNRTSIKRSIIWKNCILDKNAQVRASVICNKVHLRGNSSVFENSVIGDDTVIGENAIVKPNIKIWPNKLVDEGTEVNANLVWGSKFTKTIFGHRGIAGEINVDITPEYASKLGTAYGAIFKNKPKIGISTDGTSMAQMIKLSLISGLLSSGAEVFDFGKMLLPVTRSAIRFYKNDGGIHISTFSEDSARLFIDILDKNGSNIDRGTERKIENLFIREDFSRCEGNCIKDIHYISDYSKFYLRSIINNFKSGKCNFKVAVNSRSDFVADTISDLLNELGCDVEKTDLKLVNTRTMRESKTSQDVNYFTGLVKMGNFDLGVSVEDNSEKMMLVDERGKIVTEDMFYALISIILCKTMKGRTVIAPITASRVLEEIVSQYDGKVIRTKSSEQDIMNEFFKAEAKEEMLEQFTMHFDAIAGLAKILDFMNTNNYRLSDLVDMIPDLHIKKAVVECPWNAKGKVIRQIIQENEKNSIETIEGVKIFKDDGWVLVLPDAEQPVCRIISESYSDEFAEELTNIYSKRIKEISRS